MREVIDDEEKSEEIAQAISDGEEQVENIFRSIGGGNTKFTKVAMGGGSKNFMPKAVKAPEKSKVSAKTSSTNNNNKKEQKGKKKVFKKSFRNKVM